MRKIRQIKIMELNKNAEEKMEINLSDSLLIRLLSRYKNKKLSSKEINEELVKITLPSDKEEALNMLKEGIKYNNIRYVPLITTPSMMKSEDMELDQRCQYLFIKEEDKEFIEIFENLVSLNKLKEKFEKQIEMSINKDIGARLALTTSSSFKIDYIPKVLILPEVEYKYTANYYAIKDKQLVELDKPLTKGFTFADGCGLMSPKLADYIQENLGLDYRIDYAGIRWLLATKGCVIRADFNKYFKDMYDCTDINTKYFKKENNKFYAKDIFGVWVDLSNVDLIFNETMTKWSKWYKDEKEGFDINAYIKEELSKPFYKNYKDILSSLYITRVNKKEVPMYATTNYQLINNLALTQEKLTDLQRFSVNIYADLIFDDIEEEEKLAKTRLFLGDIAREEQEELSASTKIHRLLQLDDKFIKSRVVKSTIKQNIVKKFYDIAGGKFLVKSKGYCTATVCPITQLDYIMTRDLKKCNRGLKEREFYIAKEEGKRFTISRNPLAVFSEIQNITIAENELMKKYFGDLSQEIIIYNQKDNTAMLMSGMDFDLDTAFVVEDQIIYDAVIPPKNGRHFINFEDGGKGKLNKLTREQMYKDSIEGAGDLIGTIANTTMLISTKSQELGYMTIKDGKYETTTFKEQYELYKELEESKKVLDKIESLKKELKELKKDAKKNEARIKTRERIVENKYFKLYRNFKKQLESNIVKKRKNLKEGKFLEVEHLTESERKTIIIKQFYRNLEDAYYTLQQSMIAIDQPKQLKEIDVKKEMQIINDKLKSYKKPSFLYFAKWSKSKDNKKKIKKENTTSYTTALNINAAKISKLYISECWKNGSGNDSTTQFKKLLKDYSIENANCDKELFELYNVYIQERKEVNDEYYNQITELKQLYNTKDVPEGEVKFLRDTKSLKLTEIDYKTINLYKVLEEKYNEFELIHAMLFNPLILKSDGKGKMIKATVTSRFMLNCAWNTIEYCFRRKNQEITIFKEDKSGDFEWIDKRYKKVQATLTPLNEIQDKFKADLEDKLGMSFKVKARIIANNNINENLIKEAEVTIKKGYKDQDTIYLNNSDGGILEIYNNSLDDKKTIFNKITNGQVIKIRNYEVISNTGVKLTLVV